MADERRSKVAYQKLQDIPSARPRSRSAPEMSRRDKAEHGLSTLRNIHKHQENLHPTVARASKAASNLSTVLGVIPEPHVQMASSILGKGAKAAKVATLAMDIGDPHIRELSEPLLKPQQKRVAKGNERELGYHPPPLVPSSE